MAGEILDDDLAIRPAPKVGEIWLLKDQGYAWGISVREVGNGQFYAEYEVLDAPGDHHAIGHTGPCNWSIEEWQTEGNRLWTLIAEPLPPWPPLVECPECGKDFIIQDHYLCPSCKTKTRARRALS